MPAAAVAVSWAQEVGGWAPAGAELAATAAAAAGQSCRRSSASQSCPVHPLSWLQGKGCRGGGRGMVCDV